jgi:hypothetical protein
MYQESSDMAGATRSSAPAERESTLSRTSSGTTRGRPPAEVDEEALRRLFCVPQPEAAKALGVSLTTLKKTCRRLGLVRWPYIRTGQASKKRQSMNFEAVSTTSRRACDKAFRNAAEPSAVHPSVHGMTRNHVTGMVHPEPSHGLGPGPTNLSSFTGSILNTMENGQGVVLHAGHGLRRGCYNEQNPRASMAGPNTFVQHHSQMCHSHQQMAMEGFMHLPASRGMHCPGALHSISDFQEAPDWPDAGAAVNRPGAVSTGYGFHQMPRDMHETSSWNIPGGAFPPVVSAPQEQNAQFTHHAHQQHHFFGSQHQDQETVGAGQHQSRMMAHGQHDNRVDLRNLGRGELHNPGHPGLTLDFLQGL